MKKTKVISRRNNKTSLIDLENFNQERYSGRIFSLTGRTSSSHSSVAAPGYRCAVCHPSEDNSNRYFYDLGERKELEEEDRRRRQIQQHNIRRGILSSSAATTTAANIKHRSNVMKMNILRRVAVFFSLIVYVLVFALVLTGLVTDYWINTTSLERNGKILSSSFIHSGLFYGERQLDWGLGPSYSYFSVYDEINQKVGFMNKVLWAFVIFFIALGLLWSFIGLMVSLMNTVAKERKTILGPSGIYLWSLLSISSYSAAIFIYLLQFYSTIQKNVLLPDQITAGFSSENRTTLAFSFYLIVAAIGSLFIPMSFLVFSNSVQPRPNKSKTIPIDTTVFMY